MLPLKLVLKGLYSYQKEQIIDFTRLTEGKLFGIFGSVGSGKSSILEAISYALYGETERLNHHDKRSYNMMNLKCGELFIDFTFLAGKPEKEYKCVVSCKRHKTLFDKVPSLERKAYQKVDESWIPIETGQIPDIVGLSYQNFRRTIIIPQGKFSEFLQLGDKERTDMLKEIFHLEKFEYSEQVTSLEKKNSENIKLIEGKLEQLGDVSQEQIDERKVTLRELFSEINTLKAALEEKQKEEKELSELKELFTRLSQLNLEVQDLNQQAELFAKLEKDLIDYERCLLEFKPLLDIKKDQESKLLSNKKSLAVLREELTRKSDQLKKTETDFVSILEEYKERESLKDKAKDLRKIIKIQVLSNDINNTSERITKGVGAIEVVQNQILMLQSKRDFVKAAIAKKKSQLPDFTELNEVSSWFTVHNGIAENIKRQKNTIIEIEKAVADNSRLHLNGAVQIRSLLADNGKEKIDLNFLKEKKSELIEEQEKLNLRIEHLSVERRLEDFVSQLKENEACPLCGSTHHPAVLSIENVSKQLEALTSKRIAIGDLSKEIDYWITKEAERLIKIETFRLPLEREKEQLKKEEEKLRQHRENFVWKNYQESSPESIAGLIKYSRGISEEIKGLEDSMDGIVRSIEEENKKKEKYTNAVHLLNLELSTKKAEQETFKSQVNEELMATFFDKNPSILEQEAVNALTRYRYVTERFEKLSEAISNYKQEIAGLTGQIKEKVTTVASLAETHRANDDAINAQLKKSSFASIDRIESILSRKLNIDQERKKIKAFEERMYLKKKQQEELLFQIKDKEYNPIKHKEILFFIDQQKERITLANEESGRLMGEIRQMENNLEVKLQLQTDLEKLNLRRDDINVLKQLFKGSGFVNYVSSVFLKNLCSSANERFYKLTRQKLRLELTETNNFQVRDFLNNGQVRSVKTLSGGQTFQASLSLALALAESIQQQNSARQNFFFLDEGFGSQDKESLGIVFETLKSLRGEDRIVGVISHVSDLQEEIDIYLNVTNDEEMGSVVRGSWE